MSKHPGLKELTDAGETFIDASVASLRTTLTKAKKLAEDGSSKAIGDLDKEMRKFMAAFARFRGFVNGVYYAEYPPTDEEIKRELGI